MAILVGVAAFAGPQQILPNREVLAMEQIARDLKGIHEEGIKIKGEIMTTSDTAVKMKIEGPVEVKTGFGDFEVKVKK